MIALERLVELRSNKKLVKRLMSCPQHAAQLLAIDTDEMIKGITAKQPIAVEEAMTLSIATALVTFEEVRAPYIDFLMELDQSAVVRARPHLHAKLKELIK